MIKVIVLTGMLLFCLVIPGSAAQFHATSEPDYEKVLWTHLSNIVSYGPRTPGSEAHHNARNYIKTIGLKFADSVEETSFIHQTKNGEVVTMYNIEFRIKGTEGGRPVLLGAHFDSRPFADEDKDPENQERPILGANDGGSGTAELLALTQYFRDHRPRRSVHLVFFDGEDFGRKGSPNYFLGSKHYAYLLKQQEKETWPFCVLVIDMVADQDLKVYREVYSHENAPWLLDIFFNTAKRLKFSRHFKNRPRYTIRDDHLPFLQIGIPAVVLIDFDYPSWHTQEDTLDKCSKESMFKVFQVVSQSVGAI